MQFEEIQELRERQKVYFKAGKTLPIAERKRMLKKLKAAIKEHEIDIKAALQIDLGKNSKESYFTEIGLVYAEIGYMLRHLDRLSRSKWIYTPFHQFPATSEIIPIPYGTVLIISPWNYPFLLAMQPLVDALAAGNTVMLKPSAQSAACHMVIQEIITDVFSPDVVTVIDGDRQANQSLLEEPFDFIFFTGSKTVGEMVMKKASKNLTPAILELGGKSPVIVDESADLALAAKRIVFGKLLNAGQTCVAPDYVYVHKNIYSRFIQYVKQEVKKQFPETDKIGKIINEKQFDRIISLIDPTKVVYGGKVCRSTLQIEPTILENVTWKDRVMQEEIFGPILPVLVYEDFQECFELIQSHPVPLSFYLFSKDPSHIQLWKKKGRAGCSCLNDVVVQISNDHLPFGGMGASGMGQYHGLYGFQAFSHMKGSMNRANWLDLPFRYSHMKGNWIDGIMHIFLR